MAAYGRLCGISCSTSLEFATDEELNKYTDSIEKVLGDAVGNKRFSSFLDDLEFGDAITGLNAYNECNELLNVSGPNFLTGYKDLIETISDLEYIDLQTMRELKKPVKNYNGDENTIKKTIESLKLMIKRNDPFLVNAYDEFRKKCLDIKKKRNTSCS